MGERSYVEEGEERLSLACSAGESSVSHSIVGLLQSDLVGKKNQIHLRMMLVDGMMMVV